MHHGFNFVNIHYRPGNSCGISFEDNSCLNCLPSISYGTTDCKSSEFQYVDVDAGLDVDDDDEKGGVSSIFPIVSFLDALSRFEIEKEKCLLKNHAPIANPSVAITPIVIPTPIFAPVLMPPGSPATASFCDVSPVSSELCSSPPLVFGGSVDRPDSADNVVLVDRVDAEETVEEENTVDDDEVVDNTGSDEVMLLLLAGCVAISDSGPVVSDDVAAPVEL
jgi:hypothetical protein